MKNTFLAIITFSLLCLSFPASSASTKDEVLKLQEQVEAMQKDIAEIKQNALLVEYIPTELLTNVPNYQDYDPITWIDPSLNTNELDISCRTYTKQFSNKVHIDYSLIFCSSHIRPKKSKFVRK